MRAPEHRPRVKLIGEDGNVMGVIGRTRRALFAAGADQEYVTKYTQEAMSGTYDNALMVTINYVEVI
jgi:hypothetical protein